MLGIAFCYLKCNSRNMKNPAKKVLAIVIFIFVIWIAFCVGRSMNISTPELSILQHKHYSIEKSADVPNRDLLRMKFEVDMRRNYPETMRVFQDANNNALFYIVACQFWTQPVITCDIRRADLSDVPDYIQIVNTSDIINDPNRLKIITHIETPRRKIVRGLGIDGNKFIFHFGSPDDGGNLIVCPTWNPWMKTATEIDEILYIDTTQENPKPQPYTMTLEVNKRSDMEIKKCVDQDTKDRGRALQLFKEIEQKEQEKLDQ